MSLQSIFKYGEALEWKSDMETLNTETEELLMKVTSCLKQVQDGCEGEVVDTVVSAGEQMEGKFIDLVRAAGKMISALAEVIRKFEEFEDNAKQALKDKLGDELGGITL